MGLMETVMAMKKLDDIRAVITKIMKMAPDDFDTRDAVDPYGEPYTEIYDDWDTWSEEARQNRILYDYEEAEEEIEAVAAEKAREEEELAQFEARDKIISSMVKALSDALGGAVADTSGYRGSSNYLFLDYDDETEFGWTGTIRVSDHYAPEGSGWSERLGYYYTEPDVNIVFNNGKWHTQFKDYGDDDIPESLKAAINKAVTDWNPEA
jgi:hypothetical protein